MSPRRKEAVTDAHLRARDASEADAGSGHSKSVSRGLAVLAAFSAELPLLGVAEMADILRLSRSTAHRYMHTLAELGYLVQDRETRKYRVGRRGADLGATALRCLGWRDHHEILEQLRRRTALTVALAALSRDGALIVDAAHSRCAGQGELVLDLRVGAVLPLRSTALGAALLSTLSEEQVCERARLLDAVGGVESHGAEPSQGGAEPSQGGAEPSQGGAASSQELRERVALARSEGIALEQGQRDIMVCALAVPVSRPEGEPPLALGLLSRDPERDGAQLLRRFGPLLRRSAAALAAAMPPPRPDWVEAAGEEPGDAGAHGG